MDRTVLERFPAGGPRGHWPAEEYAGARREEGVPARVVMDLASDAFLVVVEQRTPQRAGGEAAAPERAAPVRE
ncbi:hypothetical protein [Streptomyces sp. NPDC093105]|uniref:hypothetical protein n=1 Tax=Streptomyces sp. NPDC093105 TaxID=3366029 RepID=UPI0038296D88